MIRFAAGLASTLGRPVQGVALHLRIAQQVKGLLELDPHPPLPLLVNVDASEGCLIAQPPVQIIAPLVDVRDVHQ